MAWDCACGISNKDNEGVCSGCGWSREKSNAYQRGEIPASSLDTASIVARQDLTVKLGIGGALLGGLVGYLLRPSIFLIGKLPFFTVITRGATLSGFEQMLVPAAQESFNIMLIGVIIGCVGGLILSSTVFNTSTNSTGAAPAAQTEPQTSLQSKIAVQSPNADPEVIAKQQAYRIRLTKEPGNVVLLGEYGDFLARLGAVDEALVQYFTIVELKSEDTSTRHKIVSLFKQQNNIPKATDQLLRILHIRPDDVEAQEELGRLNSPIQDDKLPSSSSSQQGQTLGSEPVQEPVKSKESKNGPRLLIVGGIAATVIIAFAVAFLQKPNTLSRIGEPANKQQSSPPMSTPSVSETKIPLPKEIGISSRAVWQPKGDEWERIYQVCDGSKENQIQCIASEMRKNGASEEAITFTQMMKGEVYLSKFMDKGILGIGTITAPVLNDPNVTEPIIIYEGNNILKPLEYFSKINISQAREYNDVVQKYPKVEIWPMGDLVEVQNLNNGEMSCVFSYLLLNGCRACEVAGKAIVAFDFDQKGFFKGQRLLKIEKSL